MTKKVQLIVDANCLVTCYRKCTESYKMECKLFKWRINQVKILLDKEAKKDNMTVHAYERIEEAIFNGDAIIALSTREVIIGFVYLVHWKNHIEIAGLVVHPDYRGQKIGSMLFNRALVLAERKYPKLQIIFFANDISKKFGEKYNFLPMPELLTNPEFQGLCKDCAKEYKKPKGCRCRVMILDK